MEKGVFDIIRSNRQEISSTLIFLLFFFFFLTLFPLSHLPPLLQIGEGFPHSLQTDITYDTYSIFSSATPRIAINQQLSQLENTSAGGKSSPHKHILSFSSRKRADQQWTFSLRIPLSGVCKKESLQLICVPEISV